MDDPNMASTERIDGRVPFQVYLEGNPEPFTVTRNPEVGPMMLGELGPEPEFELSVPIGQSPLPGELRFDPPTVEDLPQLSSLDPASTIYAGQVPGSDVDVYLFSLRTETFEGPADTVALYAYEAESDLFVDLSFVAEDLAPGYSRSSTRRPGVGEADLLWWGPLEPNVSVATVDVDGELHAAVRVRARYALFDMSGTRRWPDMKLTAFNPPGDPIHTVEIASEPPPEE